MEKEKKIAEAEKKTKIEPIQPDDLSANSLDDKWYGDIDFLQWKLNQVIDRLNSLLEK